MQPTRHTTVSRGLVSATQDRSRQLYSEDGRTTRHEPAA